MKFNFLFSFLKDQWDKDDDPLIEHARMQVQCHFVRLMLMQDSTSVQNVVGILEFIFKKFFIAKLEESLKMISGDEEAGESSEN